MKMIQKQDIEEPNYSCLIFVIICSLVSSSWLPFTKVSEISKNSLTDDWLSCTNCVSMCEVLIWWVIFSDTRMMDAPPWLSFVHTIIEDWTQWTGQLNGPGGGNYIDCYYQLMRKLWPVFVTKFRLQWRVNMVIIIVSHLLQPLYFVTKM